MRRMHQRVTAIALVAIAAGVLSACETTEKATTQPAMGSINDACPISGEAVDASARSVRWGGHTVGFCCNMCVSKWEAMTAADKNAYVARQTTR